MMLFGDEEDTLGLLSHVGTGLTSYDRLVQGIHHLERERIK